MSRSVTPAVLAGCLSAVVALADDGPVNGTVGEQIEWIKGYHARNRDTHIQALEQAIKEERSQIARKHGRGVGRRRGGRAGAGRSRRGYPGTTRLRELEKELKELRTGKTRLVPHIDFRYLAVGQLGLLECDDGLAPNKTGRSLMKPGHYSKPLHRCEVEVRQVIGDQDMLVAYRWYEEKRDESGRIIYKDEWFIKPELREQEVLFWLTGVATDDCVDDKLITLPRRYYAVPATKTYATASGASNTVYVVKNLPIDPDTLTPLP